ncbi:unnamed protein product, partial [marine sediment metagenome]
RVYVKEQKKSADPVAARSALCTKTDLPESILRGFSSEVQKNL